MVKTEGAIQVSANVAIEREIKGALLWKNRSRFGGDQ